MLLKSTNMTDKELDAAITNHMKKLDDLEITDNDRKTTLHNSELINPNDLYYMDYSGDWNGNLRTLSDKHLNMTTINPDWKCKTPYSMSNPSHPAKCNVLYSNICSDSLTQRKTFHLGDESEEEKLGVLNRIRQRLAKYQEKRGISKADYPFSSLIKLMGQITGKSLLALLYIIVNIVPMIQIVLFIMRFVLDKIINIRKTKDHQQIALKTIFLTFQLCCIYICLTFIIGLIWMPIFKMILQIISCCTIDSTND